MSEQNRYQIASNYKSCETEEWEGWKHSDWWETADNWQDAIRDWLIMSWAAVEYKVVAETPSEDGQSGITEIQFVDPPRDFWAGAKIQATPQRTDRLPN